MDFHKVKMTRGMKINYNSAWKDSFTTMKSLRVTTKTKSYSKLMNFFSTDLFSFRLSFSTLYWAVESLIIDLHCQAEYSYHNEYIVSVRAHPH